MHKLAVSGVVRDARQHIRERAGLGQRLGKSLLAEELVAIEGGRATLERGWRVTGGDGGQVTPVEPIPAIKVTLGLWRTEDGEWVETPGSIWIRDATARFLLAT